MMLTVRHLVSCCQTDISSCRSLAAGEGLGEPYRLGDAGEFSLEANVAGMLYTYQLEGVAWLYRLHTLQRGGILAGGHRSSLHTCLPASHMSHRCHDLASSPDQLATCTQAAGSWLQMTWG
jgi:hypothetical protein